MPRTPAVDATREQIKAAIAALEAQRSALGGAVLDGPSSSLKLHGHDASKVITSRRSAGNWVCTVLHTKAWSTKSYP